MKRLRLLAAAFGVVALLFPSAVNAAGPYPPPSQGSGRVDPSRIQAGQCAVFSGDGFAPATTVAITDNGVSRGTTITTSSGTFSIRLCYATNAKRGRHNLAGTGMGAGGSTLTVTAFLIVEGVRQSASNPGTQPGGAPVSGPGVGGNSGGGVSGGLPFTGSLDLLALALAGLVTVFLASLLLLLVPRRRRRGGAGAPTTA